MAATDKKDTKAAQEALEILLNVLPKSEKTIHNIVYTFGLISREAGIPAEQATEFIVSWSERLRAFPNFKELFPRFKKPSFYRYQIRYAVSSAYKRLQDKPSSQWFRDLTGRPAPEATFWDTVEPVKKKRGRPKKTAAE